MSLNEVAFVLLFETAVFQSFWMVFGKHLQWLHVILWEALVQFLYLLTLWFGLISLEQFCLFGQSPSLLILKQFCLLELRCPCRRRQNHTCSGTLLFDSFFFSQYDLHVFCQSLGRPFAFFGLFFLCKF